MRGNNVDGNERSLGMRGIVTRARACSVVTHIIIPTRTLILYNISLSIVRRYDSTTHVRAASGSSFLRRTDGLNVESRGLACGLQATVKHTICMHMHTAFAQYTQRHQCRIKKNSAARPYIKWRFY